MVAEKSVYEEYVMFTSVGDVTLSSTNHLISIVVVLLFVPLENVHDVLCDALERPCMSKGSLLLHG